MDQSEKAPETLAADKGYHSAEVVGFCQNHGIKLSAVTQIDPSWVEMNGFKMTHPEWGYGRLYAERETVTSDSPVDFDLYSRRAGPPEL